MEIDEVAGKFRLSSEEQDAFNLVEAEWPITEPFQLIDAMNTEIDRLIGPDPSEYPLGVQKNQVQAMNAAGFVLKGMIGTIHIQLQPYLERQILEEAESIVRHPSDDIE